MAVFTLEAELMLFLHMCTKESTKRLGICMAIEELFHRKSRLLEQMDWSDFYQCSYMTISVHAQ